MVRRATKTCATGLRVASNERVVGTLIRDGLPRFFNTKSNKNKRLTVLNKMADLNSTKAARSCTHYRTAAFFDFASAARNLVVCDTYRKLKSLPSVGTARERNDSVDARTIFISFTKNREMRRGVSFAKQNGRSRRLSFTANRMFLLYFLSQQEESRLACEPCATWIK